MVAKRLTGEAGKEDTLAVKEAVFKNEMETEDTPGMAEAGREVVTGPETLEAEAGKWTGGTMTTAGGGRREGPGRRSVRRGTTTCPTSPSWRSPLRSIRRPRTFSRCWTCQTFREPVWHLENSFANHLLCSSRKNI